MNRLADEVREGQLLLDAMHCSRHRFEVRSSGESFGTSAIRSVSRTSIEIEQGQNKDGTTLGGPAIQKLLGPVQIELIEHRRFADHSVEDRVVLRGKGRKGPSFGGPVNDMVLVHVVIDDVAVVEPVGSSA